MKIRVAFTVEVPASALAALRELASADNNSDAADFVRWDAMEYVRSYLDENGIPLTITEKGRPWA